MYAFAPEFTGDQVLQDSRRDEPSLFLGAIIMAEGLVAAVLYTLRRKRDPRVSVRLRGRRGSAGEL
jgi:hypothetical protein